jgi:hypothetical protein
MLIARLLAGLFMRKNPQPNVKNTKVGKRLWQIDEPFFHVPAGYITNGASVPRLLWVIVDPATEAFEAALIHDYDLGVATNEAEKDKAHRDFKDNLIKYDVRAWRAYLMYFSVYLFHKIKRLFK